MIKVCGITNLEDALAAVEAGVDALGFNFYRHSRRYLTAEAALRLTGAIPAGVLRVGVFVNETPQSIRSLSEACRLDIIQLHGEEQPADVPAGLRVWKAFRVEPQFHLAAALARFPLAEAILLDGPAGGEFGGAGHPFLWQLAAGANRPIVLAGGLDPSNVAAAVMAARPWGVDACSRLESAPGKKDHLKMNQFVTAARAALLQARVTAEVRP
jgi:phosphoribosylanthranilate isomerase